MSFKNENWESSEFRLKNLRTNTNVLPTNRNITGSVPAEFLTYNSNNMIPCYPYQVVSIECLNRHGVTRELMQDMACVVS